MKLPIQVPLEPFIPCKRGRGVVLEVRDLGDGTFELATIVPGFGSKQGGVLTAKELFDLGRRLTLAVSMAAKSAWDAVPIFPDRNGSNNGTSDTHV